MNKTTDQLIREFAKDILKTPDFKEFMEMSEALEKNKEAKLLFEEIQERKQTLAVLDQNHLPVSEKQQKELEAAFVKMRNNEFCMKYLKSQNAVLALARQVCNQLTSITGIPFSGGCCCS